MSLKCVASEDALLARADRAIADAAVTRNEVRAGLVAAGRRPIYRVGADKAPTLPAPLVPLTTDFLEPWWAVARSLNAVHEIMREADHELGAIRHQVLPITVTPLALIRG